MLASAQQDLEDAVHELDNVLGMHGAAPWKRISAADTVAKGSDLAEAAQALAKAVLEAPEVVLAIAVLQGGPFAIRRALELAEVIIESNRDARGPPQGRPSRTIR